MSKIYNFQFPKYGKLILKSVWKKGKKGKELRFLFDVVENGICNKVGEKFLLWFEKKDIPFAGGSEISISSDINNENYKTQDHIKIRVYNYYKLDLDNGEELLEEFLNEWLNNKNNLFPETLSSYGHVTKDKINYSPVIF